jgi:hypothetical protein
MVQCRHCVLCRMPFHSRLYAMFNLKHYMPSHWEYNAQNAPNYEKWGTDLVWKWWNGLHALYFVTSCVNFEKDTTMVTITSMPCTQTQVMDVAISFAKLQRDIRIGCKSNSTLEHIPTVSGSTHKGRLFVQMFSILKSCLKVCRSQFKHTFNFMVDPCMR